MKRSLLFILAWIFILAWPVTAGAATLDFMPSLIIQDYLGTPRVINNLTMEVDSATSNATWQMIGSSNQQIFTLLDSRKDVPFSAGTLEQFNFTNTDAFRYYYLYLVSGFDTGTTLEYHLDYTTSDFNPKAQFTPYFNFTQKRSPLVFILDFSRNDLSATRENYTVTSSATIGPLQTWYLYGTNTTPFLGSSNTALLTLLDTQTAIAFTGGVTQIFDISSLPPYKTYVIYVEGGFPTLGTRIDLRIWEQPVIPPTPTPTPPPLPSNCTATISANVTEGWPPLPVKFSLSGNVTIIDSILWSFGDGNTSTEFSPSHVFTIPGSWTITASATNTTYSETCNIKRFNLIDILRTTYTPHSLYVSLLLVLMGGMVYTVLDNKNKYYGNIIVGIPITILAFYLAFMILVGGVASPVILETATNHTIINGTVLGATNLSYITTDVKTLTVTPIFLQSSSFGWLLVMFGLIIGSITTLNTIEVVLGIIKQRKR